MNSFDIYLTQLGCFVRATKRSTNKILVVELLSICARARYNVRFRRCVFDTCTLPDGEKKLTVHNALCETDSS